MTKVQTPSLDPTWIELIGSEFKQDYFQNIKRQLLEDKTKNQQIFPPSTSIFAALDACPVNKVKVVILGQDPYHGPGQAHGLSFSVPEGIPKPPSLVNIFKELKEDLNINPPNHGNLTHWANQGVLLLNTSLTVVAHQAGSHSKIGWSHFTDAIIQKLSQEQENLVFILWGGHARGKKKLISNKHFIIESPHPSPLSSYRGFFGSKPFSQTNSYLKSKELSEINWELS